MFKKARTGDNRMAYDSVDSLSEVPEAYKRCRKEQSFILSEAGAQKEQPKCDHCRKPITGRDNRGHYRPRTGRLWIYHYVCAWQTMLDRIV